VSEDGAAWRSSAISAGTPTEELDEMGAVMMKDETTCIRCAMCASRCPTHAILMKHFDFHRACVTVATRNPKVR
jgi:ferredoxin